MTVTVTVTATVYTVRQRDIVPVTVHTVTVWQYDRDCVHSDSVTMSVYTATSDCDFDGVHSHSVTVSVNTVTSWQSDRVHSRSVAEWL